MNDNKEKVLIIRQKQIDWLEQLISLYDESPENEKYKDWIISVMDFLINTETMYVKEDINND